MLRSYVTLDHSFFKPAPQRYWDMFAKAKVSQPLKPRQAVQAVDAQLFPMPAAA